jgi:hypothetical protein
MESGVIKSLTQTAVDTKQAVGTTFADLFMWQQSSPWDLVWIAIVSAFLGMITHWAKKYYKDGNGVTIVDWFWRKNPRATLVAVLTMLGTLFATFAPLDYTTITLYQTITQAFTVGYAADSFFNTSHKLGEVEQG